MKKRKNLLKRISQKCSLLFMTVFLPPLIQTTSLESDYKALTYLGYMNTPVLQQENRQQTFENVLCSCVRVQVEGHYGSGSIYRMQEDEIVIVTNRHVLQYWNEDSYVTFFDGTVEGGRVLGLSEEADIGFISVSTADFSWEELLHYRNISLAASPTEPGTAFLSIDMASDIWNPTLYTGEVISPKVLLEDFQVEMLYGSGFAIPGMSGAGVFDGYGNYLGMMTGGTLQDEIAAVPAEAVANEYEKLRLTEKTSS